MRSLALALLIFLFVFPTAAQPGRKPKPTAKPSATPVKKLNESTEWEKASAVVGDADRVAALKKFVTAFPKSTRLGEAAVLIATAEASLGNERLAAGDVDGAVGYFKAAASDAAAPMPEQLFNDTLIKFPANLYFRGARQEAIDIAKTLETKASDNAVQLLSLAAFYISIENGSEGKRLAEAVIKIDPGSAAAYQTLGLANRIDFLLDDSAAAYAKAVEIEPDSLAAKRGLAEMKRSLGMSDEAAALYREILEKDATNVPAQTGLILSLFDAGKRTDAEGELAKALEAVPDNVMLLAGAAYWYAAHDAADKAVEYARRAVDTDPRFIWSHIALGRGLMAQGKLPEAERTLLAARRYGNFPTLEYEIASVRVAAGYYREAAEGLATVFSVKDGVVKTHLGGRVTRESANITELIGYERRASISAPTAADNPANAARVTALLGLKQLIDAPEPNSELLAKAADDFIKGDDRMKVHRQIFAATQLLDKKTAFQKVIEIAAAAVPNVSAGLDDPNASLAVTAGELYEPRAIAAARGDYVNVPVIPRMTLSAIIRGQIEEIAGWASFNLDDMDQAVLRLRRSVAVLPADSAWWRSSSWRLATALAKTGSEGEALDLFIKSYKSSGPSAFRYTAIETLYKKVKGSADGLDALIGPDPARPANAVAQVSSSPTPEPTMTPLAAETPAVEPMPTAREIPSIVPVATPEPSPVVAEPLPTPSIEPTPTVDVEPTPVATPEATPVRLTTPDLIPNAVPVATPTPEASPIPAAPAEVFPSVVILIPQPGASTPLPTPQPTAVPDATPEATPEPSPTLTPEGSPSPTPQESTSTPETAPAEPTPAPSPSVVAEPTPTPTASPTPDGQPKANQEPVVRSRFADVGGPVATRIKPCKITFSEEAINLQTGGGDLAVIVGREDDAEVGGISAVSSSPADISVRRQQIAGMKTRALFVVRPLSERVGLYQITFEMACAKRDLIVNLR
ncbi:MAG: hypothetical protein IPM59_04290 [Chloracidobacterium sp.]|nr:hypothetical protein [Chloracidobacterium sp.]